MNNTPVRSFSLSPTLYLTSGILIFVMLFLSVLSVQYQLGIVGIVVFIRFIIVTVSAYQYSKGFIFREYPNRFVYTSGGKDPQKFIIFKKDILSISLEEFGLFNLPKIVFYLKNGGRQSISHIKNAKNIYFMDLPCNVISMKK